MASPSGGAPAAETPLPATPPGPRDCRRRPRRAARRGRPRAHDLRRRQGTRSRAAQGWGDWELESFAGYADRAFGARDFYAPFPSFEATRSFLGWTRARGRVTRWLTLEPRLAVRTHRDRFWLRRDQPQSYENDHLTRRFTGELRGLIEMGCLHSLAVGVHGLPLIGSGDWNDGMDRVGILGKGESVWLGFFLCDVLRQFARLADARGDSSFADLCRAEEARLRQNIEQHAWDLSLIHI